MDPNIGLCQVKGKSHITSYLRSTAHVYIGMAHA